MEMKKIAFFDTKPYDKESFDKLNNGRYEIKYFETRLTAAALPLADGCDAACAFVNAEIDRSSWNVPTIFKFIQNQGKVDRDEMYRVFNMGIGYVVILPKNQLEKATNILKAQHQPYSVIGVIRKGEGVVTYKN